LQHKTGLPCPFLEHMNAFTIKSASDFRPDLIGAFADVPFDTYAAAPGINKSGLDTLRDNPAKFNLERTGQLIREATDAMEWGTLVHEQILFGQAGFHVRPDIYGEGKKWNGNATECKMWIAEHCDKPVLTCHEATQLRNEADAVLDNQQACELLKGGHAELSLFAREQDRGFLMKARLDYFGYLNGQPYIVDIKTMTDASTPALSKEILNRRYHVQFAHYRRMLERLGLPDARCFVIALEKGELPRCQVREIGRDTLTLGEADLDNDLRLFWRFKTNDYWPDFADDEQDATGVRTIDVPEYVLNRTENLAGMTPA
jgi:hypothetical protein